VVGIVCRALIAALLQLGHVLLLLCAAALDVWALHRTGQVMVGRCRLTPGFRS